MTKLTGQPISIIDVNLDSLPKRLAQRRRSRRHTRGKNANDNAFIFEHVNTIAKLAGVNPRKIAACGFNDVLCNHNVLEMPRFNEFIDQDTNATQVTTMHVRAHIHPLGDVACIINLVPRNEVSIRPAEIREQLRNDFVINLRSQQAGQTELTTNESAPLSLDHATETERSGETSQIEPYRGARKTIAVEPT
jgi:hypothetical protein